jgi:hypothetical protein
VGEKRPQPRRRVEGLLLEAGVGDVSERLKLGILLGREAGRGSQLSTGLVAPDRFAQQSRVLIVTRTQTRPTVGLLHLESCNGCWVVAVLAGLERARRAWRRPVTVLLCLLLLDPMGELRV